METSNLELNQHSVSSSLHDEDYQLLTTIRYDPFLSTLEWNRDQDGPSQFLLLPRHVQRLSCAAKQHGWSSASSALDYEHLKSLALDAVRRNSRPCRVRILLSKKGHLSITSSELPFQLQSDPMRLSLFTPDTGIEPATILLGIYVDKQPTPISIFTSTKTTQRRVYDEARERNGVAPITSPSGSSSDVLLFNKHHFITETTVFNVAFYRSSSWITPVKSTGCLPGVVRRWLLDQGRILEDTEGQLKLHDIKQGEIALLFNGLQGCRLGKIMVTHEA